MTKPEYDKVGIKKALGELVSAWQPAIASEAVVQARREAEAKVWAEVDAVFQLGAATTASPVQGAASASEAKGAAVEPWQERTEYPHAPAAMQAEIADWRALTERAQAAQPSGAVHFYRRDSAECWRETTDSHFEHLQQYPGFEFRTLYATPAPEQEAAQVERATFETAAKALGERAAGHFRNEDFELQDECLQCAAMLRDMKPAAPVPATTPAEQPQGDVMRPFGATAGQHGAGGKVLTDVRIVELAEAWAMTSHAYQSTPLNHCLDFARAIETEVARRFRAQGGNTITSSGTSSTAFDDQWAADTDKGGEA